jgi:NAD(P)-dependent dehydrogenase (short-subunit alcohol dehydrogenase family)
MRLDGKACVVTGAGSGIGRATAIRFAAEGGSVLAVDIDGAAAARTAGEIGEAGGHALDLQADVTRAEDMERAAETAVARFGRVDVLVANAGISAVGVLHETPPATWDRVFEINVRGTYLTCKAVIPRMISQQSGTIIIMSSVIASMGLPNRAAYAASKGALLALAKSMQVDYGRLGIRVNALQPGTIFTPLLDKVLSESPGGREEALRVIRARQFTDALGQPDDVAQAAVFLASDESAFVLGSGLFVDGGSSGGR